MALFTTAYFPCVSYMACFLKEEGPAIEIWETYRKQTYRNRCRVMTANGVQSLSVPVIKVNGNHTMTKDVVVSYDQPWQQIHRRCLESAYKASPYFDHYYPYIEPLLSQRFDRLIDLNDAALKTILKLLKTPKEILHTSDYAHETEHDFREAFNPKNPLDATSFPSYYQVFGTKFPFAPDLSILDLLFNEGPSASRYLSELILSANCFLSAN